MGQAHNKKDIKTELELEKFSGD